MSEQDWDNDEEMLYRNDVKEREEDLVADLQKAWDSNPETLAENMVDGDYEDSFDEMLESHDLGKDFDEDAPEFRDLVEIRDAIISYGIELNGFESLEEPDEDDIEEHKSMKEELGQEVDRSFSEFEDSDKDKADDDDAEDDDLDEEYEEYDPYDEYDEFEDDYGDGDYD